jgi:hypothetical protein
MSDEIHEHAHGGVALLLWGALIAAGVALVIGYTIYSLGEALICATRAG